jgi:hypothetical protein
MNIRQALLFLMITGSISATANDNKSSLWQIMKPLYSGEPFIKRLTIGVNTDFALADYKYVELADGTAEKQEVSLGLDNTLFGLNSGVYTSFWDNRLWAGAVAGFDTRLRSKEILVNSPGGANVWKVSYLNSLAWLSLEAKATVDINLSKLGFFGGIKGVYKMGQYTGDNADNFRTATDSIAEYKNDFDIQEEFLVAPYAGLSFSAEQIELRVAYEYLDYQDAILDISPHRVFITINYMIDFYKVVEF